MVLFHINRYSPANIVNHASEQPDISVEEQCAKRYETMREKVKEIDPSLEIAFIPRTLYDLFFIQQTIQEDISLKTICCYTDKKYHTYTAEDMGGEDKLKKFQDKMRKDQAEHQCWHLCYFDDAGNNHHTGVKEVAYRLNQVIVNSTGQSDQ